MPIVERYAKTPPLLEKEVGPVQNQQSAIGRFGQRVFVSVVTVCVGKIGECRSEESQRCAALTLRRQDEQWNHILRATVTCQTRRVDSAPDLRWKLPRRARVPTAVF